MSNIQDVLFIDCDPKLELDIAVWVAHERRWANRKGPKPPNLVKLPPMALEIARWQLLTEETVETVQKPDRVRTEEPCLNDVIADKIRETIHEECSAGRKPINFTQIAVQACTDILGWEPSRAFVGMIMAEYNRKYKKRRKQ